MAHIAAFERHNGRVPNLRELAKSLGLKGSELRALIGKSSLDEKSEGTSAFNASLREILLEGRVYANGKAVAAPPVAQYGMYKYDQERRAREAKKARARTVAKELKLHCSISSNDYKVKLASVKKFLKNGDDVKLVVVFREHEVEHSKLGINLLDRFAADLDELAVWSDDAVLAENTATMFFSPISRV